MRKLLLLVCILALPAHAGLGSLLKAAGKAGTVADDAARVGAKHVDDAKMGAYVNDGTALGDDVGKGEKNIAGDVAQEAGGVALDVAASSADSEPEGAKHARRVATLDALEVIALETRDLPLQQQVARIRLKESARHAGTIARKR